MAATRFSPYFAVDVNKDGRPYVTIQAASAPPPGTPEPLFVFELNPGVTPDGAQQFALYLQRRVTFFVYESR